MAENSTSGYYEESSNASLRYPEIAVCLEQIDRLNPKTTYKFRIPSLTPDMNSSENAMDKKITQKNDAIENETNNIEVKEVNISNYLELPVPRELLTYIGKDYKITGRVNIDGSGSCSFSSSESYSGSESQSGSCAVNASGSVSDPGGSINVSGSGSLNGSISGSVDSSGTMTFNGAEGLFSVEGELNLVPINRYIEKGSQWIVLFIGGDVNKPRLIAPYDVLS